MLKKHYLKNVFSGITSVPFSFTGTSTISCAFFNPITVNSETICQGACAALTATGGTSYTWAASPDLSATNIPNINACPISVGAHVYSVTGTGACGVGTTTSTVTVLATTDPAYRDQLASLQQSRQKHNKLMDGIQEIMVMREMPAERQTNFLKRGAYDAPGDAVSATTPAVFGPFPTDQPRNRLGLARWLTDPEHPLTARVVVNRFWQECFGAGLVRTPEDYGSQGNRPSH